jgi:hypothetical protein
MNVSRIEREGMSLPSHASATLRISTQKAGARTTQLNKLKKNSPITARRAGRRCGVIGRNGGG